MLIDRVIRELNEMRRGRGLQADDIHIRVGNWLRMACEITRMDDPPLIRRKLTLRLTQLSAKLPTDLELAAMVALGLHNQVDGKFLDQRITWLAKAFGRDPRTARRRIDSAFRLLAELLYDTSIRGRKADSYSSDGWYVESLKSVLRMDVDPPTLTEERRIIAQVDDLDELILPISAPRAPGNPASEGLRAEIGYGGEIVEAQRISSGHSRFIVRLPEPLKLGQSHDYSIQFKAHSRAHMRPYYVFTPLRRCEEFTVRVRFENCQIPRLVWRINGLPTRAFEDFTPGDDQLTVDRVGDVVLKFHDLQQGLSYGLQWQAALPSLEPIRRQ